MDSLEFLEVLFVVEERLGVSIDDSLLVGLVTVGDVMAVLDAVVGAIRGSGTNAH